MKNKKILIPAAVLAAAVVIGLLVWLAVSLTRPSISAVGLPAELAIVKGETAQLEIEYGAEGNASAEALEKAAAELTLEWTSSDEAVATVDENGLVTAVEAGTADITVSVPDTELTSTCKVTVTVPVEGVQAPDEMQLTINGTASKEIGAKLVPEDATGVKLVYESSDENIATVDENGMVTAVAKGECVITTSVEPVVEETADSEPAEDTDSSASEPADSSAPASSAASEATDSGSEPADTKETPSVDYSSMTAETKVYVVTAATGLKLSSDSGSVKVSNTVNVSVYTEPEEADAAKAADVKYTSSDESVATVIGTTEGDAAFTVKGVKAGSVTITIEYQGLTATYEVTVTKAVQTSSGGGTSTGTGSTGGGTSTGGSISTGGGTTTTTPPSGGGTTAPSNPTPTPTPAPTPKPSGPLEDGDNLGDTWNPGYGTGDNQVIGKS